MAIAAPSSRSWSIYGRAEISARYEVLARIGSGAYADVYRGRRRSDGLAVALKEIHDAQSALREIDALRALRGAPNVVSLLDYFLRDDADDDAVLVLDLLPSDLAAVIAAARRSGEGIPAAEAKQWMLQILRAVDACHRSAVVHRDLKPSNLLVSADGVVKLADFGQARILHEPSFAMQDISAYEQGSENEPWIPHQCAADGTESIKEPRPLNEDDYLRELDGVRAKFMQYDTDKEISLQDCDASCLATCSTGDIEDDRLQGSYYSYEAEEGIVGGEEDDLGALTSCVGTRWFRAPELLYGSTSYGLEIDLWSLGCIFAELLNLEPLFPGSSDLDQLSRIISVLGDFNEESCPHCSKLPDYDKITFTKVENPTGLDASLPNRSAGEVNIVKRLLCYDPASRATAGELLSDQYFTEEPLPVPVEQLKVPARDEQDDESSPEEWGDFRDLGSDSDLDEFGTMDVTTNEKGFCIRFE